MEGGINTVTDIGGLCEQRFSGLGGTGELEQGKGMDGDGRCKLL